MHTSAPVSEAPKHVSSQIKDLQPQRYVRVADVWTTKQKEEVDKHEKRIQEGHEQYSAY
jgi:hypothetical protein